MWSTETIKLAGVPRTYDVYRQQLNESCGPSCVMMAIHQIFGQKPAEAIVRLWCGQIELLHNRSGVVNDQAADARVFNFDGGAEAETLRDVLRTKKQVNARFSISLVNGITACTPAHPGIARLVWALNGRGHFVLSVGRIAGDYVYLDPWYGLIHVPYRKFPEYLADGHPGEITRIIVTNP